jgi:sulfur carrier protein
MTAAAVSITINGKAETVAAASVTELLQLKHVEPNMVSVEHNGEILDRDAFHTTPLHQGDRIEFLYYMGGGRSRSDAGSLRR